MSEERFDRIEHWLDRLEAGQNLLREALMAHDGRLEDLGRQMRVLHEDTIARIAATREYTGPTTADFAELKGMLGRRLDPLEAVVREHSIEIERLKRRRK